MNWWHYAVVKVFRWLPTWISKWVVFWLKRKYVIGVVAVVPNAEGQFLFLHHTYRKRRAWRLPGGLKERREEPFVTAVRELEEEANIRVEPVQVIGVQQSEITLDIAVLCTLVEIGPFTANAEIDAVVWVKPSEADFEIPIEQVAFIDAAHSYLRLTSGK